MKKNFLILCLILFLFFINNKFQFILNTNVLSQTQDKSVGEVHVTFTTVSISVCPPGILGKGACQFPDIIDVIHKFTSLVIEISPFVFVILIIIGGFMYLFSPFKFEQIKTGHKYIMWAIYGFILVLITSLIFEFIANIFGGPNP
jgi:hypothetical protein